MPWFRKRVGPQIAVRSRKQRPEYEEACQRIDAATTEGRLPWQEYRDEGGKRSDAWVAEADLPSGRFRVLLRYGMYGSYEIGFRRVGEFDTIASVELRDDFGEALYDRIRRQVYGPVWAKEAADRLAAIEEARGL